MAELDKKIQKTQTDLIQAVAEAQERKNLERVDILIINAIKQLKMSRFKPDQTICLSLTYLAKINPRIFSQSVAIKDTLKSLLRRDNGPTNIKGKGDTILPILAANILLASCDTTDVKLIILNKIEQWLNQQNQKVTELMQHLLSTLCMKCQNDQKTIISLLEMRQYWLQYLYDHYDNYGSVPSELCTGIRRLLQAETNCDSLITYLKFLIRHDKDIVGLSHNIGKFLMLKPITLDSLRRDSGRGPILDELILQVFIKLFKHLTSNETSMTDINIKSEVKSEPETKVDPQDTDSHDSSSAFKDLHLYMRLPDSQKVVKLSEPNLEAILSLLAMPHIEKDYRSDFQELLNFWIFAEKNNSKHFADIFEDFSLTKSYNINDDLRLKLVQSSNDLIVELGLKDATSFQLINLLQKFGTPISSLNKIIKRLESLDDIRAVKSHIVDFCYFKQLTEFYSSDMKITGAKNLNEKLEKIVI